MTRNKKTFRLAMLGLFCAGLLMIGIGAGVAFAEYSSFTYAGQRVPEQAQTQSQSFTAALDPEAPWISISGRSPGLDQLAETASIEVSEELAPGTVRLDLQYRSAGPALRASWDREVPGDSIRLYWTGGSEVELLMTYKDRVLADIRDRRLGEYVAIQLTKAVVTVNPADAEKIVWDMG